MKITKNPLESVETYKTTTSGVIFKNNFLLEWNHLILEITMQNQSFFIICIEHWIHVTEYVQNIVLNVSEKLYCIVLYCIVLYCVVLCCVVLCCVVLCCVVLCCVVLCCVVLCCVVLCFVLCNNIIM